MNHFVWEQFGNPALLVLTNFLNVLPCYEHMKIGQGVHELWSDIQPNRPSEITTLYLYIRYTLVLNLKYKYFEFQAFLETNIYLLVLTFVISIVHSVFEFLAFKNDIQFWNNRYAYFTTMKGKKELRCEHVVFSS